MSRRKSCSSCVRAKTRCSWPAAPGVTSCTRCHDRGAACEFKAAGRLRASTQMSGSSGKVDDVFEIQTETESPASPSQEAMPGSNLSSFPGDAAGTAQSNQGVDPWDIIAIESYLSSLRHQSLSSTTLFHTRPFAKPGSTSCVSLALRLLRSYPSMMAHDSTLPPFISPQLYSGRNTPCKGASYQVSQAFHVRAARPIDRMARRHWPIAPALCGSSGHPQPTKVPCGNKYGLNRSVSRPKPVASIGGINWLPCRPSWYTVSYA